MIRAGVLASTTQSFDLTATWTIAILSATFLPPLLAFLHRWRWQLSIRGMLLATTAISVALAFMVGEAEALWQIQFEPQPNVIPDSDYWWHIPAAFILSLVITFALIESRNARRRIADQEDSGRDSPA